MNRKIYFYVLATIIIVAVAAWNVALISKVETSFNVTLATSEALAQVEEPYGFTVCSTVATYIEFYPMDCGGITKTASRRVFYICAGSGETECYPGEEWTFYDCYGNQAGSIWLWCYTSNCESEKD